MECTHLEDVDTVGRVVQEGMALQVRTASRGQRMVVGMVTCHHTVAQEATEVVLTLALLVVALDMLAGTLLMLLHV